MMSTSTVDVIRILNEAEDVIEEIRVCVQNDCEKALEDAETMLRVIVSLEDLLPPTCYLPPVVSYYLELCKK